jgi:hypothetical protein
MGSRGKSCRSKNESLHYMINELVNSTVFSVMGFDLLELRSKYVIFFNIKFYCLLQFFGPAINNLYKIYMCIYLKWFSVYSGLVA